MPEEPQIGEGPDQPREDPDPASGPEQPLPGRLVHQPQEIAYDHPDSRCNFQTPPGQQLLVTPAALEQFGMETILACFYRLQVLARLNGGLDYLQVFQADDTQRELWFVEDAPGVITALLPEDR